MPSAGWTSAIDSRWQFPHYFVRIDGLTSKDFSTHPIKNPTRAKSVCMDTPSGGGVQIDPIEGTRTSQQVVVPLWDVSGEIAAMIATEAPGAPLATLVNLQASVFWGYAHLDETEYLETFRGRIISIKRGLPGQFLMTLADPLYVTDAKIMANATDDHVSRLIGNPVNIYYSLLTGSFSGSGDFPLGYISTDDGVYTVPTGLQVPAALVNTAQLISERDNYYSDAIVDVTFNRPENGKQYLEREFFRTFQCYPPMSGGGLIGLRFRMPPLPTVSVASLTHIDHIEEVLSWERSFRSHLNQFTYLGDYENGQKSFGNPGAYNAILYNRETEEDLADRAATSETVEYKVESQWLKSEFDGAVWGTVLAGRMRSRYQKCPATGVLLCNFRAAGIQEGDIVYVTHPEIPNLLTGAMGVSAKPMEVLARVPRFDEGKIELTVEDVSFRRYGLICPDATPDYASASPTERATYAFISSDAGLMSNGDQGYRLL